jgi:predicted Zn finger-like uncharacterized protein
MAIVFTCDKCGKQLSISDESAGKRVRCPGCNTTITVPVNVSGAEKPAGAVPSSTDRIDTEGTLGGRIDRLLQKPESILKAGRISFVAGAILVLAISFWSARKVSYFIAKVGELTELSVEMSGIENFEDRQKHNEKIQDKAEELGRDFGGAAQGSPLMNFFKVLGFFLVGTGLIVMILKGQEMERLAALIVAGLLLAGAMGTALPGF